MEKLYIDESGETNSNQSPASRKTISKNQKGISILETLFLISSISFLSLSFYKTQKTIHQKKIKNTKRFISQWRKLEKK